MSPTATCYACGALLHWRWEEAFDKFGFGDGDGNVQTDLVANALSNAGYTVDVATWGLHNTIIERIRFNGLDIIPATATIGYDDPRTYLPPAVIALLDRAFPREAVS